MIRAMPERKRFFSVDPFPKNGFFGGYVKRGGGSLGTPKSDYVICARPPSGDDDVDGDDCVDGDDDVDGVFWHPTVKSS